MDPEVRKAIETECVRLSNAFSFHLDHKNYDDLVALFVPHGVFIRTGVRLEGHARILQKMRERPAEQFTRHVTTNFHFTHVDESTATSVFYNLSYFAFTAQSTPLAYDPQRVMLLDFLDTYTKTADGWRFLQREARAMLIPEQLRSRLPPEALRAHT
jgi:SnoaL-like domain